MLHTTLFEHTIAQHDIYVHSKTFSTYTLAERVQHVQRYLFKSDSQATQWNLASNVGMIECARPTLSQYSLHITIDYPTPNSRKVSRSAFSTPPMTYSAAVLDNGGGGGHFIYGRVKVRKNIAASWIYQTPHAAQDEMEGRGQRLCPRDDVPMWLPTLTR